jgi:predicted acylesterase/phospholipase RssA
MRIGDVISALSAVTGLPSSCEFAKRLGSPSSLRFSPASLLTCFACVLALHGCAGFVTSEATPSSHRQPPVDRPVTIRTLGSDQRFSQLSSAAVAERLRALHTGEPLNILALSGGGAFGAFGAGAMVGLARSGSRPEFAVVTGVSAGALVAPYAFLGPTWDARLRDVYTGGAAGHLLRPRGLGAVFGSSLYSGKPLRHLVDAYASDEMVQAIAREAAKGRLLLVATTDVATAESVVWDLGSIARNGGPNARTLFRDVLVASASVPGIFPPVIIRVPEDGVPGEQAHVDGGATAPFFVPPAFVQTAPEASDATHHTAVYVIVDGPLGEASGATRLTTRAVLSRSIHAGLNHLLRTTLQLTAATAQLQGATLQYAAVPATYPHVDAFDFRAETMRPLFNYADECARAGRLWTAFGNTGDDRESALGTTEMDRVPCPADDAFIGHFASR